MITLAVQCQHFERRLCWLLSSMLEQTCKEFAVDVTTVWNSGVPSAVDVCVFFGARGLPVVA